MGAAHWLPAVLLLVGLPWLVDSQLLISRPSRSDAPSAFITGVIPRLLSRLTGKPDAKEKVVYVLKLEHGHIYVGQTTRGRLWQRVEEHRRGQGAKWTALFPPVGEDPLLAVLPLTCGLDEDVVTKRYMLSLGVTRVRGGSYSAVELPGEARLVLYRELYHALGLCVCCGRAGHFANECPEPPPQPAEQLTTTTSSSSSSSHLPREEEPGPQISESRTYLTATYHQRLAVKRLGARYDGDRKKWYVLPGTDLRPFRPWLLPADKAAVTAETG